MAERITAQRLRQVLDYDQQTGTFTWRVHMGAVAAGRTAGNVSAVGGGYLYIQIAIDSRSYYAHQLALLHVTGTWPAGGVGFEDGNGLNLAYANLKLATNQQRQQRETAPLPGNKCGMRGVSPGDGGFLATTRMCGRKIYLGRYATPEEAQEQYLAAKDLIAGFTQFFQQEPT